MSTNEPGSRPDAGDALEMESLALHQEADFTAAHAPHSRERWIRDMLEKYGPRSGVDFDDGRLGMVLDVVGPAGGALADAQLAMAGEVLVWNRDRRRALAALVAAGVEVQALDVPIELVEPIVRLRVAVGRAAARPRNPWAERLDPVRSRLPFAARAAARRAPDLHEVLQLLRAAGVRAAANPIVAYNPNPRYTAKGNGSPVSTSISIGNRPAPPLPGAGVKVAILDTGHADENRFRPDGWLDGITGPPDPGAMNVPQHLLAPAAGHGDLVAGLVRRVAPGVDIEVHRVITVDGIGLDTDVTDAIVTAASNGAHIINLSLGTSGGPAGIPMGLQGAMETLAAHHPSVLVVAAAGNDNDDDPRYPAALPGVIGVAATFPSPLGGGDERAAYSNHGWWVDFAAPGTVASTFIQGTTPGIGGTQHVFHAPNVVALAVGTSYATPQVVGALAVQLANGLDRAGAVAALEGAGTKVPDIGYVLRPLGP